MSSTEGEISWSQTAERLLTEGGFTSVAVHNVETDLFNAYHVTIKET